MPTFSTVNENDFISFLHDGDHRNSYPTHDEIHQAARHLVASISGSEEIDHADKLIIEHEGAESENNITDLVDQANTLGKTHERLPTDNGYLSTFMNDADVQAQSTLPGQTYTSRCVEEDYCIILKRSDSATSKGSNSRYRCRFCNFEFIGGPQKIRVHLTGKSENNTRLSKCKNVPEDVKVFMESRFKTKPKVASSSDTADCLSPRNWEEYHCIIISRDHNPKSKRSNSKYRCRYCDLVYTGGPQKIRVHLSGANEGSSVTSKCPNAPEDVVQMLRVRRKTASKENIQEEFSSLVGSPQSSSTGTISSNTPAIYQPLSSAVHSVLLPITLPPLPPMDMSYLQPTFEPGLLMLGQLDKSLLCSQTHLTHNS